MIDHTASEFYKTLIESSIDIITVVDSEGQVVYINPSITKDLGYSCEAVVGKNIYEFIHPDDHLKSHRYLRGFLKANMIHSSIELRLKHCDGTWPLFDTKISGLTNTESKATLMITCRDITKRVVIRKHLRQLLERRQTLLKKSDDDHEKQRITISRRLHQEISQSLSVIRMNAELLKKGIYQYPELADDENISQLISYQFSITDQTLESVNSLIFDLRPPLLDQFGLNEAMSSEAERLTKQGVTVEMDTTDDSILPDEVKTVFYRIFTEIIDNIDQHAKARNVHISSRIQDDNYILKVKDDGVGIPSQKLKNNESIGLLAMKERAKSIEAGFKILSQPQQGTTIEIISSLENRNHNERYTSEHPSQ